MTRISQLIAVVSGVKTETESRVANVLQVMKTSNGALFNGQLRSYQPHNDDGTRLPAEDVKVRTTAGEALEFMRTVLSRQYDIVRTLDEANAGATADVKTRDGKTLLKEVPVGHLIWLAKELDTVEKVIRAIPVLDEAKTWGAADDQGVHRADAVRTIKTVKTPYNHVKAEATQYHPAQVELMNRDEVDGFWTTVPLSGAIETARKQVLLDRVLELREAVKMAREEANSAQVRDVAEGKALFDWLLR